MVLGTLSSVQTAGEDAPWSTEIREWLRSRVPRARTELLEETLERLRRLFAAPRALMVWEEADEPWVNVASLDEDGDLDWKEAAPSSYAPLVAERLAPLSFFAGASRKSNIAESIHPSLCSDYQIRTALSLLLEGDDLQGRIFLLDLDQIEPHHFVIGEIVTAIVEERFLRASLHERNDGSELDERVRMIARDLHDGLLQSFTGIVLQLENLIPLIEVDPEEARRRVTDIEGVLMNEQRELRSYLENLREKRASVEIDFDMTGRLRDLATRYQEQWGVQVQYRSEALDPIVRKALGWETYRIISEAVTNATRHGNARRVDVELATREDQLRLTVKDDGDGFMFRGRRSGQELLDEGLAPVSLTERIHGLNGEIFIESTDVGATLEISIPVGWRQP